MLILSRNPNDKLLILSIVLVVLVACCCFWGVIQHNPHNQLFILQWHFCSMTWHTLCWTTWEISPKSKMEKTPLKTNMFSENQWLEKMYFLLKSFLWDIPPFSVVFSANFQPPGNCPSTGNPEKKKKTQQFSVASKKWVYFHSYASRFWFSDLQSGTHGLQNNWMGTLCFKEGKKYTPRN